MRWGDADAVGLGLVTVDRTRDPWLHYGVLPAAGRHASVYGVVRDTARELLDSGHADEFFFVHKPPGLRVRFLAGLDAAGLDAGLRRRLLGWQRDGLVATWQGGTYEPEELLFGGRRSMRSVHRLFTSDSLAWLGYHTAPDQRRVGALWAMSLLMVRDLLAALEIVGWEELDVWDRLRWQAGRRFAGDGLPPECERVAAAVRTGWAAPERLAGLLPADALRLVRDHGAAVAEIGKCWRESYFTVGQPVVGPREAAAFAIVFHWNRAGLSTVHQTLLAEALCTGPGGAPR